MRRFFGYLAASVMLATALSTSASQSPREVNVTQGSTAGWIPSEELEAEAISVWRDFYTKIAEQDYEAAWQILDSGTKQILPLEEFVEQQAAYRTQHGSLVERSVIKLTWTKDGPSVPQPGTYLAIDSSSQFEKTARECGYTILFKAPGSNAFTIKRTETVAMSDAAFAASAETNSPLSAALVWNAISSACPNYVPPPLPASVSDGISFGTVEAARKSFEARDDLDVRSENGWTVMVDEETMSAWSFSPRESIYHPTVIRRTVKHTREGGARMEMAMKCEVEKSLCDALYTEMAARNGIIPVTFDRE